ncbi:hypothetical protein ACYOEI_03075 [Singulisphaera rosea]
MVGSKRSDPIRSDQFRWKSTGPPNRAGTGGDPARQAAQQSHAQAVAAAAQLLTQPGLHPAPRIKHPTVVLMSSAPQVHFAQLVKGLYPRQEGCTPAEQPLDPPEAVQVPRGFLMQIVSGVHVVQAIFGAPQ